jgi:hypothetical protein
MKSKYTNSAGTFGKFKYSHATNLNSNRDNIENTSSNSRLPSKREATSVKALPKRKDSARPLPMSKLANPAICVAKKVTPKRL